MGFATSMMMWLVMILIIACILFAVFSYILGYFYPVEEDLEEDRKTSETQDKEEVSDRQYESRRRWIGLFAIAAVIVIAATSGYNALMSTKSG